MYVFSPTNHVWFVIIKNIDKQLYYYYGVFFTKVLLGNYNERLGI